MNRFDALPFNPHLWTSNPVLLDYANCYVYVLGDLAFVSVHATNKCNPGCLSGTPVESDRSEDIVAGAVRDGLILTGNSPILRPGHYPVALLRSTDPAHPGSHWLRKDDSGQWSGKYFKRPPEKLYWNNGLPINDLNGLTLNVHCPDSKIIPLEVHSYFNVSRTLSISPELIAKGLSQLDAVDPNAEIMLGSGPILKNSEFSQIMQPFRQTLRAQQENCLIPRG